MSRLDRHVATVRSREGTTFALRGIAWGAIAVAGARRAVREDVQLDSLKRLHAFLAKANAEIEGAKRAAVAEIHAKAADLATSIAGKILQRFPKLVSEL